MNDEKSVIKSAGIISSATFISRLLGFLRDALTASFFGMSVVSDAFFVAQRIPNLLRRLLAEGALSAAFIPVFTDYLQQENGKEKAREFSNVVFSFLFIILLVVSISGVVFSRQIVQLITLTSSDVSQVSAIKDKFELTVELTRVMFPFIFFIGIAAQVMGVLNSLHRYFFPAIAPAVNNICLILCLYFLTPLMGNTVDQRVFGLAWGVLIGGAFHLLTQLPGLIRMGFGFRFNWKFSHSGLKRVFSLMGPAVFGLAVTQINIFVDTMLAWKLGDGAISALYYSNRLVQLPMGVFGVAIATASFPVLSSLKAQGNFEKMKEVIGSSLRFLSLITFPATIGLIVFGKPVIRLLFEHGKFNAAATESTYFALIFYTLGIFFFGVVKLIGPVFYAFDKSAIPVKIASWCMILNIFLNLVLMRYLQHGGLALATSLSGILNAFWLYHSLIKQLGHLNTRNLMKDLGKILFATILMGVSVYVFTYTIELSFSQYLSFLTFRLIEVAAGIVLAVIVYGVSCYTLKIKIFLDQYQRILSRLRKTK